MSLQRTEQEEREIQAISADLKEKVAGLVEAFVAQSDEGCESGFVHLLARSQELVDRKRAMEGTKSDTRDLVGELLFSRLRQAMRTFLGNPEAKEEIRAAEWAVGALFSIATLTELAHAFDQVLIRQGMGRDFSFAGRTDFISVEEVLQMLAASKHVGCLSLEKADNRLDIYLQDGLVAFLDPHHMIRRVMPSPDPMRHREIPEGVVALAEAERKQNGKPVFLTLVEEGHFRREELREVMRFFGKEVMFDFMREPEAYNFFYRRFDQLPAFATESHLRISVTSMLLECSKQVDDWRQLLKVFPDPQAPLEPSADMFARMADVTLGPMEIKLLSQLNGDVSAKGLVPLLGIPLFEVYQTLVRMARDGILNPPGGADTLTDLALSVQESLQMAFAVLDANDDEAALAAPAKGEGMDLSVLDRVFGDAEPPAAGRGKVRGKSTPAANGAPKELLELLRRNRQRRGES